MKTTKGDDLYRFDIYSLMNKAIYMKRQAYTYYYIKYPHSVKVH